MIERKYLAVITDQHITEPGTRLYGLDTNESAKRVFDALKMERLPELVVSLGDLADTSINPNRETATASEGSYAHARNLLDGLKAPVLTVAGNHDEPELMEAAFPSAWESHKDGVSRYFFYGTDLISVDVRNGPGATGWISAETCKALDETLSEAKRAVIFSHFPLFDLDNERIASGLSLSNREELAPVLQRHRDKIIGCFSGHLHIWLSGVIDGIPVISVPSSSFGFSLEPMSNEREKVSDVPCGYLLIGIGDDGSLIMRPRFHPGAKS
jgi:Icc protein